MNRPRLLDAFCGAGGASFGYHLAGFDVVGVDIAPMPRYPFEFHQGDAIEYLAEHWREFDAIHASPPCQAYTTMSNRNRGDWPDLIGPTRAALERSGLPSVMENVPGARKLMRNPFTLHGGMFGLPIDRPRLFETRHFVVLVPQAPRTANPIGIYGKLDGRRLWTRADGTVQRAARTLEEARQAMGMPWADWDGIREAIPPAYTEFIGRALLETLESAA